MSDSEQTSRVGTQFGPYHLKRLLGRGGMGEVYEADHTVKEWTVAIKVMSPEFSRDPVFRKRMEREARTTGKLQDPHIVPVHEFGEIDGQLYLEMHLIAGTDLFTLLKRYGPLTPPRAVAIIRQVASALDAAHAAGVTHRDVKPENILITGDDFAYLVDFGIASASTDERLTQMGSSVGTWKYMAPERFGKEEVTYRADVYALACVLHECLTGSPPYPADTTGGLVAAHMLQPVPCPSQVRPGVPSGFDAVIARGMAKNPEDRYASCGDLALAAHQVLSAPAQDKAETIIRHSQEAVLSGTDAAGLPQPLPPSAGEPEPTFTPPPAGTGPQPSFTPPPGWTLTPAPGTGPQPSFTPPPGWTLTPAPGTGPQPAGRRLPARKWIMLAGLAAAVAVAIAVVLVLRPSPQALRAMTSEDLDAVLLNGAEINDIMNTYEMESGKDGRDAIEATVSVSPPDCLAVMLAGAAPVYAPSGYSALHYLSFAEPGNGVEHSVIEAAAVYPSAEQASAFVAGAATSWKGCAGKTVTVTDKVDGTTSDQWSLGSFTGNPPQISVKSTKANSEQDGRPWVCDHELTAVSNAVLDVIACGYHVSDEAGEVTQRMSATVSRLERSPGM